MKKILGLDLGTTSIGWALVNEAENKDEVSNIVKLGVRLVPLSVDEKTNFDKGKPITTNADRTLKRGARRNLQRFKLRRKFLIDTLRNAGFLKSTDNLTEIGNGTTHETLRLRAIAATQKIPIQDFVKVLLLINKKRGYKSSRKSKNEEEGSLIDGMSIAKELYVEGLTPGEFVLNLLNNNKKYIPDFYRSDLQNEFDLVWNNQKTFYPKLFLPKLKDELLNKNKTQTWAICKEPFNLVGIKQTGKANEKRLEKYNWRTQGLTSKLELEQIAIVLQEINNEINKSSGYLGAISDRSKSLYFNKETVGQNLYKQIQTNPHTSLKNQVFYRQDYLDEFERLWETQAQFNKLLTLELKTKIRDVIIFYQRRLKSQKGLIGKCELESKEITILIDGTKKNKTIGPRVVPKSSPLFQEFKIWQNLNNLELRNENSKSTIEFSKLDTESRYLVFEELNLRGNLKIKEIIKLLKLDNPKNWQSNFEEIQGNKTNKSLFNVYQNIAADEGYGFDWNKKNAQQIKEELNAVFPLIGINNEILNFDPTITGNDFDKQASFQLWHLLYASEDDLKIDDADRTIYGNNNVALKKKLCTKFGFKPAYANMLANISLEQDYGSLSSRAIRKIIPHLQNGNNYADTCSLVGYNHSGSLTKEGLASRTLDPKLTPLKKNSLRNPVVEKILNQMVNVINQIIDVYGKPDEVRVEMARELKQSAKEREKATQSINKAKKNNDEIRKILQTDPVFKIKNPVRNDIIKYKLYEELAFNGYKTLYTNRQIKRDRLFSNEIDIEHIIPKALVFDDSFSNKTLSFKDVNLEKSNTTAFDYMSNKRNNELEDYVSRVEKMYNEDKISKGKYNKLLQPENEISNAFINRDLVNSQYIAKKAKEILSLTIRTVNTTSGRITAKLREDWDLINVMKELNLPKYEALGLVKIIERKNGNKVTQIIDWTKRNDHRHHAVDALTVAFTTYNHVNYLNNKNAARFEKSKELYAVRNKITATYTSRNGNKKRKFIPPMLHFREQTKEHLESLLISFKNKNKITTNNINKIKIGSKAHYDKKVQLTPRGELHEATVYGRRLIDVVKVEKIGSSFDESKIITVTKPSFRVALLSRLNEFGNDPKKAFTGKNTLSKNPIYLDKAKGIVLPSSVKTKIYEYAYTIRKPISHDLKIEKVVDKGIKEILIKRLKEYEGDSKKAFGDLHKNPIWLDENKSIALKRVTITGLANAEAIHDKRDHLGELILDKNGRTIPVDFVNPGNNHHVAIYRDASQDLQAEIVSFFEAVTRINNGFEVINKSHNKEIGWEYLFSLKKNEMFVIPSNDFNPRDIDLLDEKNNALISKHLFYCQSISIKKYGNSTVRDFVFRHHLDSLKSEDSKLKNTTYFHVKSLGDERLINCMKVRIDHLGRILHVGEF